MYFGVTMLFFIVTVLSVASFQGVLKFRKLTKNIKARATELPLAANLSLEVNRFSSTVWRIPKGPEGNHLHGRLFPAEQVLPRVRYDERKKFVEMAINTYEERLKKLKLTDSRLGGIEEETEMIKNMRAKLRSIHAFVTSRNWAFESSTFIDPLDDEIYELQKISSELPTLLKARMDEFSTQARTEYHTWMVLSGITSLCAFGLIVLLYKRFKEAIFQPLEKLLAGTRKVAGGDYDFRIQLNSDDEVAELADSFNLMTSNFQSIKSDLNEQVQERTKEVVRSEQMASVGFLAAGVAHEINNPLNTIAWSAESLESRLHEMLAERFDGAGSFSPELLEELKKNLRRIQDEAFRCKGITDSLLDYARMGDAVKSRCNMRELVESVVEMVRPLGKYRQRNLEFQCSQNVTALVNPQEMKQVTLNLVTNALDSVPDGGSVQVSLKSHKGHAILTVQDDGCGMTDEVKQHLFEPFFTRREQGMGTGLGLSITYRIVEEHGGVIEPQSDGPGLGSTFIVRIPTVQNEQKRAA
jgi:signal transduction histidine kinase